MRDPERMQGSEGRGAGTLNLEPRTSNPVVLLAGCVFALSLSGCAQQADMIKQEKELTAKIAKSRADLDQLIGETRARFNQELATLREEELPALRGNLDKGSNRFDAVQRRLDDIENKSKARLNVLEKIQFDQANLLKADRDRVQGEMAKLAGTFGALAKAVDTKLDAHDKAIAAQAGQLTHLSQSLTDLSAKMAADNKLTSEHLAEVNKSVSSVAKALRTVGEAIETREAEQDRRMDEMAKALHGMAAQAGKVKNGKSAKSGKQAPHKGGSPDAGPAKEPGQAAPGPATSVPDAAAVAEGTPPVGEGKVYEQTLQAFKNGDYAGARRGFSEFLQRHPDSKLAGNAQYWLGECYYGVKDYGQAVEAFDRVQRAYPDSAKVPAALLKKGFAYAALNDRGRASSTLKQVVEAYPRSPEAMKAKEKLAQLQ
ncbi:MAG TPA: tol-pal system protein YbgF [Nitrospiraceae bacterium]